jgi:hypothetical protein
MGREIKYLNIQRLFNAGHNTVIDAPYREWGGIRVKGQTCGRLPVGQGVFARIPFYIPGRAAAPQMLLVSANQKQPTTISVRANCTTLYLLHTMTHGVPGRVPVIYRFRYTDGSVADHPLTVGTDLGEMSYPRESSNCRIGWRGYQPEMDLLKVYYVSAMVNHYPRKPVSALEIIRHDLTGNYVLAALTMSMEAPLFKKIGGEDRTGRAVYFHLEDHVLRVGPLGLNIIAELRDRHGRPICRGTVTARIAGKRYCLPFRNGAFRACIPRPKTWRTYANTIVLEARRKNAQPTRHETVFYNYGFPRMPVAPHGFRPPQFIVLAFDDCKGIPGLERMLAIIENLRAQGARVVYSLYVSPCPDRSPDIEKAVILYQRLFDLGCEFCNHTLNHSPGGIPWYSRPRAVQQSEVEGCRQWLMDRIHGLDRLYGFKSSAGDPGAGNRGFIDPAFTRRLVRRQHPEYYTNTVRKYGGTYLPAPEFQPWPYKLGPAWTIDMGLIDGNAPPVHTPITKGFYTDYAGKFDYGVQEGIDMLTANLEHRYRLSHRPPLIIDSFHEWGFTEYYPGHRNESKIVEGFLEEVLIKRKRRYADVRVVTLHELIRYMKKGTMVD